MGRAGAAVGSAVFFALAPGVVAGVVPWWLTGWEATDLPWWWLPLRVAGVVLLVAGAGVLVHAFARFVAEGVGTPAPVAPTRELVVGGLYRYVRNPMYLAVAALIATAGATNGTLFGSAGRGAVVSPRVADMSRKTVPRRVMSGSCQASPRSRSAFQKKVRRTD
jgi:protein-S-isoprenylcysteine O-methyltransferase Ste14